MKKLNLVVGVLVAIALVVLIALLFISPSDIKKDDTALTPTPPISTATATPLPSGDTANTPIPSEDAQTTPEGDPLEGETLEIVAFIGREKLYVTYSSELYTRRATEIGEEFYLLTDSTNGTFIEIVFIEADLELRKASFLDAYVADFTEMNMLGQVMIAGSTVAAEGLSATDGSEYYEAWLIEVEGGFFAIVAGYTDEESRIELYRMLDTLEFSL